ncbi:hypothetical protein HDV06_000808 [Boothiomyces sp. JEL0866]|nr:hypothetical protein HDV06_000808 [Boothiomyces sp. JEL0866]
MFSNLDSELGSDQRSFCVGPVIRGVSLSSVWSNSYDSTIQQYLSNVLSYESLDMLMWTIGNGLIDPVDQPRILYLYSNGGHGKSTIIDILNVVLRGTMKPLSEDYLSKNIELSTFDIQNLIDCRFTSIGDSSMKDGKINESFWKTVTGGDSISTPMGIVCSKATLIVGSNDIWYPNSRIHNLWFTRRGCVIPMKQKMEVKYEGSPYGEDETVEKLKFIMSCIRTRLQSDSPPVTMRQALMTIFGRSARKATRGIKFVQNDDYTAGLSATWSICLSSGLEYDNLIDLVESMSKYLVIRVQNSKVLRNIVVQLQTLDLTANKFIDKYCEDEEVLEELESQTRSLVIKKMKRIAESQKAKVDSFDSDSSF